MLVEDREAVKQALAIGQVAITDPTTGHHRSMYADCPNDGHPAGVWRIVRGAGHAIIELTMRCPTCGIEFITSPESVYLR